MEEMNFRGKGLEAVSSSEQTMVIGGISPRALRRILNAVIFFVDAVINYGENFKKGFREGWESI
jgi:hypothetical protein